jgi:multidrug efflux system membrane fusion protein
VPPHHHNRRLVAGKVAPWFIAALLSLGAGAGWWVYAQKRELPASGSAEAPAAAASRPGGRNGGPGGPRFGGAGRIQPVAIASVRRQDIHVTIQAIGSITAANTAVVRSKIEGELKAIHFKEGQLVKAGALLAELDNRAAQIALSQAEGQLARDQAQLQNARLDLVRFKDLLSKDGIAKQQVDTQEAQVRQLQGTVQADQAQVDNAKLQLSYTRIVAPISGRIGLKQADLGNVVRPTDAGGLISIAQTQPVNVVFAVPDLHLTRINQELKAGKLLKVEAWDRDQKTRLAVGQVASTDNAIDAATGTIKLKAAFANADGGLFPNQFVNVRLQLSTIADSLAVPAAALLRNADGNYVYLVNEDKTVSVHPVQAGASDGDWVGIQSDLQPGDRVVVDGVDRLRNGATVEVIQPQNVALGAPGASGGEGGQRRRRAKAGAEGASAAPAGASANQ